MKAFDWLVVGATWFLWTAVLVALLMNVGCTLSDETDTSGGTPVYGFILEGVPVEADEVDYIAGELFAEFQIERFRFPTRITLSAERLLGQVPSGAIDGRYSGFAYPADGKFRALNDAVVHHADPCLAKTALAHELAHLVLYQQTGDSDPDHGEPVWHEQVAAVKIRTKQALCLENEDGNE